MLRFLLNLCHRPGLRFGLGRDSRSRYRNTTFASFLAENNRRRHDADVHGAVLQGRKFARRVLFVACGGGAMWVALESAKALLEADDLYSREKLSEYSHTISFWWSTTGLDYFRGYLKRLRATSRSDISKYISNYVQNKPHVGLAMMSDDAVKASGLTEADLIGVPQAQSTSAGAR